MTTPPLLFNKNDLYRAYILGKNDGKRQEFQDLIKKILWEREEHERIKRRNEKVLELQ